MKNVLKFLLFSVIAALVLTFAQASTFVGVWAIELEFLSSVWASPLAWLGSIILWKYVLVIIALLSTIVAGVITLIRKSVAKRKGEEVKKEAAKKEVKKPAEGTKKKKPTTAKAAEKATTDKKYREIAHETPSGVVHSGKAKTSSPRGFTRVTHTPKK